MNKSLLFRFAAAVLLTLAGAAVSATEPAAQWTGVRRDAAPVTWAELDHAGWIADGRDDAPRKVYVFTDANCPYCTRFWSDARPWVDSGQVQLRHLLVAVIAPSSAGKAATLMLDPDPAKRLADYERAHAFSVARMMAGGPRHPLADASLPVRTPLPEAVARTLIAHDQLMQRLSLSGTPGLVFLAPDGMLTARVGVPPDELERVLGPR